MGSPGPALKTATLTLLVLIWGTTWAAIRISLRGFPPLTGVAARFLIAGLLLLLIARVTRTPVAAVNRNDQRLRFLHAICSFCISYGVVFWAEQWVPSGLAAVLFATFPLLVAVMAHFALPDERMTGIVLAGTLLGFAGIAVIFAEDFDRLGGRHTAVASAVMLLAPLASAVASVAVKRWGKGIRPVPFNGTAMLAAAVAVGVVAAAVERDRPVLLEQWPVAALLYMALVGTALSFPLYFWLLEHMQARQLALIGYGTPVVAMLLGVLLLGEPWTARVALGSAMVLIGVAAASLPSREERRRRGHGMRSPGSALPGSARRN